MTKSKIRIFTSLVLLVCVAGHTKAQEPTSLNNLAGCSAHFDESAPQRILPTRFGGRLGKLHEAADSLCCPTSETDDTFQAMSHDEQPLPSFYRFPWYWGGGLSSWNLHKGLNVQVGASVFAQFGKGAHKGAGFQENISLVYALPVTEKLSVAVGGYLNNINYIGNNWYDAGLSAVVGYRFNEHWEAYIYGQKSIVNNLPNRIRYSMYDGFYGNNLLPSFGRYNGFAAYSAYDLYNIGDRIGATLRYNVNPSLSVEVSVEKRWAPNR